MRPKIVKSDAAKEFFAEAERCYILETWRSADDAMTIARARVEPGVTTAWHALEGVTERYIIASGAGRMEVGDLPPAAVGPGDTVFIPAGVRQRITNTGATDLIFYCVCTPPFMPACYRDLEK
ncbi:MAG: cupin domain-containing protein [Candidatus Acidiferrales bacterium]